MSRSTKIVVGGVGVAVAAAVAWVAVPRAQTASLLRQVERDGALTVETRESLQALGGAAAGQALAWMRDEPAEVDDTVVAGALAAIGKPAVPGLEQCLGDRCAAVRGTAALALGQIGAPEQAESLWLGPWAKRTGATRGTSTSGKAAGLPVAGAVRFIPTERRSPVFGCALHRAQSRARRVVRKGRGVRLVQREGSPCRRG